MKHDSSKSHNSVELPTPTAWPIVTAFGLTLVFAAFVTHIIFAIVGGLVGLVGAVGWCLELFPHPKHEPVPIRPPSEHPAPIRVAGRAVRVLEVGQRSHRARIPVEVHPYTAGAFGGVVGAVVMAVLACLYGIFKYGSIWYPINLLAAAGVPSLAEASLESLRQFSLAGLVVGSVSHLSISILIGLLYAVLLPMLPAKFEWLWGGIVTPLIWTGLVAASLHVIAPKLAVGIDWPWFIVCQVAFGMVCGYVVFKSAKVETQQSWSLPEKLGVEAQHETEDKA
ncbi:MAG TPA: hypothetical protein VIS99_10995 [Terrimicrobiaceae bacterium]